MTYLFDFDGTLVDSMPTWAGYHIRALTSAGIPCPKDFVQTITPLGTEMAAKYTISLGVNMPYQEYVDKMYSWYYHTYLNDVPLKPHVVSTLYELKNKGHRLAVLTASPHLYVDEYLEKYKIYDVFDKVWSSDDFVYTKAESSLYKKVAECLHQNISDCTMVDDNLTVILAAKEAGMKTVAVYDSFSESYAETLRNVADMYIYDFSEL